MSPAARSFAPQSSRGDCANRKHTGERPFQCHCGRQFSRLDNVRQHASTVHADQQEKNQETIANLVALHNKLSASTVAKQKEAGMIVHDQHVEARPPKRKAETTAAAGGRGAEPKPKKSAGGKKKGTAAQKAKEQAGAAAELGQQIAGDLDRIASQPPVLPNPPPVQSVSPYEPPNPAQSSPRGAPQPPIPPPGPATYPYATPPQYPPSNYANYNGLSNAYYGGGASVPYPQMYGGTAPGNAGMGGGGYPGMDYYGAYPPQAGPSGVSSAPQAPQYYSVSSLPTPPAQHDRARYTSNIPTSLPYPPAQPQAQAQAQADAGALTPNKISLPSISALMADPSPAAAAPQQGQQRTDSDPNAQQQQQSYYAAMRASGGGGPNSRPPSTLGMPPPQQPQQPPPHHHHQQQQQQQYAYHQQPQHGEMQYHQHQHQQQQHQPHPQAMAAMYGLDPYARPGSTNGSEREGPPS